MAFDRNDAADLLALKNEVNLDPAGVGYNPDVTAELLSALNDAASNPGPDTGNAKLELEDLLEMLFTQNISAGDQFRVQLIFEMSTTANDDVSRFKAQLSALDTGLAADILAHKRPLSRAEVLFAELDENGVMEYVNISRNDWIMARES